MIEYDGFDFFSALASSRTGALRSDGGARDDETIRPVTQRSKSFTGTVLESRGDVLTCLRVPTGRLPGLSQFTPHQTKYSNQL